MRIFPEGTRDAMEPTGQALIIIAGCILVIAASAFGFKTWILYSWSRVNGTVVSSRVATETSDEGVRTCSVVESVQYAVDGHEKVIETGGHSFTSNCKEIEAKVAAAPGQIRAVAYNKRAPGATYINPGFTFDFYWVAVILTLMAGVFGFGGWTQIRVYRWMVKREIDLP